MNFLVRSGITKSERGGPGSIKAGEGNPGAGRGNQGNGSHKDNAQRNESHGRREKKTIPEGKEGDQGDLREKGSTRWFEIRISQKTRSAGEGRGSPQGKSGGGKVLSGEKKLEGAGARPENFGRKEGDPWQLKGRKGEPFVRQKD